MLLSVALLLPVLSALGFVEENERGHRGQES
jgi:hypothetical protein